MIRVILIDDEPLARSLLKFFLNEIKEVEIVGAYENGFEGLKGITDHKPDLVFLDIQMPKLNGFEMLELLDELPYVIFVTAYNHYAVKAFENNAVDYLLKPYSQDRLVVAVQKAKSVIEKPAKLNFVKTLVDSRLEQKELIDRIAVKTGTKIKIIYIEEVEYLESQDDYVMIYTAEGKFLKQKTMKFFESHLPSKFFIRIHRSYMIRIDFVAQIELYEKESFIIKLKNGKTLPISKSGYNRLRTTLNF